MAEMAYNVPLLEAAANRVKQLHTDAGLPFPCILGGPCEDDPTFLAFGAFPCSSSPVSVVCSDPLAFDACPVNGSLDG